MLWNFIYCLHCIIIRRYFDCHVKYYIRIKINVETMQHFLYQILFILHLIHQVCIFVVYIEVKIDIFFDTGTMISRSFVIWLLKEQYTYRIFFCYVYLINILYYYSCYLYMLIFLHHRWYYASSICEIWSITYEYNNAYNELICLINIRFFCVFYLVYNFYSKLFIYCNFLLMMA